MERELRRAREQLEYRRLQRHEHVDDDFDPHYDYGFTQASIKRLARLLARNISSKPVYVDVGKVFTAIQRCYENFSHSNDVADGELLTLLTTAYASNWFTRGQRVSLNCWLQSSSSLTSWPLKHVTDSKHEKLVWHATLTDDM